MNGSTSLEGRVEVFYTGQWGVICDGNLQWSGGWDDSDARY